MDARTSSFSIRNGTELKRFVKSHANATPEQLVRAITISLNLAVTAHNADVHHRLNAGRMFVELRQEVEAEGADWWQWQKGKFDRSRKDIEKLMRMAKADDPEAAAEQERTQTRQRVRAHRSAERAVRSVEDEQRQLANAGEKVSAERRVKRTKFPDLRLDTIKQASAFHTELREWADEFWAELRRGAPCILAAWAKKKSSA